MKNCYTILLLSRGVPMLLAGDEFRRSQGGNNNPYNQDNETSWFDWTLTIAHGEMVRYVQRLIAFRKAHPALWQPTFYTGTVNASGLPDIAWHGSTLGVPRFDDCDGRILSCTIAGINGSPDLHVMMNMFGEPVTFELPTQHTWRVVIDTFATSPNDIPNPGAMAVVSGHAHTVQGRSIVVLTNGMA